MSEWIDVKDNLPEPYKPCIVFMALHESRHGLYYDFAFYAPPSGLDCGAWGQCPTYKQLRGSVTHWMPLPPAPEAQP